LEDKLKYLIVSTIQPSGHCTEFLIKNLQNNKNFELFLICEIGDYKLSYIKKYFKVFRKDIFSYYHILKKIIEISPDIINVQHEMNMYGNKITSIFFPIFLFLLKIFRFKIITTVHSVVDVKEIDENFLSLFNVNKFIPVFIIKLLFQYIYKSIIIFSDKIIVHTNLSKRIYLKNYTKNNLKISKISFPTLFLKPNLKIDNNLFVYFGYFVRRKNLKPLINDFIKFSKLFKKKPKLILMGGIIQGQENAYTEIKLFIESLNANDILNVKLNVSKETADYFLKKASCVLIPANLSMGSSGPLLHYYNNSKFVLASSIGHLKEDIINKKTGILVNKDNWLSAFIEFNKNKKKYLKNTRKYSQLLSFRTLSYNLNSHLKVIKSIK
jgi:hypothetical protein